MEEKKEVIADLHIHSKYSRATSKNIDIPNLVKWAKIKGLNLLGTGDFTHPKWFSEIKSLLVEKEKGVYSYQDFPFILSTEISLMYTKERGRRVHLIILAPSIEVVEQINKYLGSKGRLDYDGRPIFKIPCPELTEELLKISKDIEIIPAHCLLGEELIHTNNSIKRIKDIKKGDLVYTHNNNWKKVSEVLNRKYSGKIYKIKSWYFTEGLKTTSEHPFYSVRCYKCNWIKGLCKKGCSKSHECKKKIFEKYFKEWVPAFDLKVGDFLVYPRFNEINDKCIYQGKNLDKSLCKLIGYYLAEGYVIREEGVGFSFNKNEEKYINEVINLIKEIFKKEKYKIDDRKGKDIIFYSKEINKFFNSFYNSETKRANTKSLPNFMLELPLNKQVEIFKGWYYGDKGYTTSRELMNQIKIICLRLGIIPSIRIDRIKDYENRGKHYINNRKISANYDLYCSDKLSFFEDYFSLLKEKEFMKFKTKMSRRHGWLDKYYIYIPIRKIEIENYEGEVYNLEVEDDNSYVTEFACVHNCWTPWFGVFGSQSGFNSLKEAFEDKEKDIHAIETGMSSDPEMNWKLSFLNEKTIVSFSDAHSFWPWRMGREATIFEINKEIIYDNLIDSIRKNKIKATIEVDPAYGKYHWDGHRLCNFSCSPKQSKELNNICPVCKKQLIIGVENRVGELSDQETSVRIMKKTIKPYYKILPLHEIIGLVNNSPITGKKTMQIYDSLIQKFQNELNILLHVDKLEIAKINPKLAEIILQNRMGNIKVKPGYDGVYGEAALSESQKKLF